MKSVFFFLSFLCLFHLGQAQTLELKASKTMAIDRFIGYDSYQNLYFIKDRVLHKQGKDGNFTYNALQLGRISSIDIINPLKVVVFFEDTNTVVLIDNKLNEIERINFNNLANPLNVGKATTAGNNNLWIFNNDTQQLELFQLKSKTRTAVSQPFNGVFFDLASDFNYCYILTEFNLRVFNRYGSFLGGETSLGWDRIYAGKEKLIAVKADKLFYFSDLKENISAPLHLDVGIENIKDIQLQDNILSIFDGEKIHFYSLESFN